MFSQDMVAVMTWQNGMFESLPYFRLWFIEPLKKWLELRFEIDLLKRIKNEMPS